MTTERVGRTPLCSYVSPSSQIRTRAAFGAAQEFLSQCAKDRSARTSRARRRPRCRGLGL